ncbi:MAG: ATP-binding protein [Flavobacteriaceae bacterium]|nr:ATP-binding protein [Flavobacteriaceae bacterium]
MYKKILITGGPGTGKTELVKGLEKKGYECEHEIVRKLTEEGQKKGIEQLFLKDPIEFSNKLMNLRLEQFKTSSKKSHVFFDRGVHEIIAYLNFLEIEFDKILFNKSKNVVYDHIFILPPWREIYRNDNARYESFEDSVKIYNEISNIYKELNVEIIVLEKTSIKNRIDKILKKIDSSKDEI